MKKVFKRVLAFVLAMTVISVPNTMVKAQEEVEYSALFSWNFTQKARYSTPKVTGTSATAVSWNDYRGAFMAFDISEVTDYEVEWVIEDNTMVFDNGRVSGQAPTVTIKLIDGDTLVDIYSGTMAASAAHAKLTEMIENAVTVGTFSTITSDTSGAMEIGEYISMAQQEGKKNIGFYLTCREEDNAHSAGIVNFVNPKLTHAPVFEVPVKVDINFEPVLVKEGKSVTITPGVIPSDAVIMNITTSNEDVIDISTDGKAIEVAGISAGFARAVVTVGYEEQTMEKVLNITVCKNGTYEEATSVTVLSGGEAIPVLMDREYAENERDYRQIKRAAGDLRQDMALVGGIVHQDDIPMDDTAEKRDERLDNLNVPGIIYEVNGNIENAIIVGEIEASPIIRNLILEGKLDEAVQIRGNWEGYVIKKVENPVEGIENAIVIAGSDARGTIYGIYNISEYLGVSPWYWWSDVAIRVKENVVYDRETIINRAPDVQYRGIFINDEERLVEWAEVHFPDDVAMDGTNVNGPNEYIYNHMFEVVLRLGANTLWPAMHEYTTAFNYDTDGNGIPYNAKAADEYGVVMSSSHCEIMLRNNVGEWEQWYNQNKDRYNIQGSSYNAAYDYTLNKDAILAYWRERLISNKDFESIFVLGIRGVHDGRPLYANLEGAGYGSGTSGIVNMMKDVIGEQRKMIAEVYGSEDGAPQVFIPYKEMNTYYNHNNGELASWLPEDVIVMYAEDNQNYLRQTSAAKERARAGGLGIYYHNSYWGVPKSYLWLNSTPITLMYEEMKKAYDTGAKKYWILNVGDLKPGELNAEFFMRMAWNIDKYDDTNIYSDFYKNQGMRDYSLSEDDAQIYQEAMRRVNSYIATKKAEFFGYGSSGSDTIPSFSQSQAFPYSITEHGDEGQRMVDGWNEIVNSLGLIWENMDEECKDAFYEQVYHAVLSYRNRNEEYVYYWKNQLYAQQGRYASAKRYAELSKDAVGRLEADQDYFDTLHGGKWEKMLNFDHIIYYQRNQGILRVDEGMYSFIEPIDGVGAVCEGQSLPSDDVTLSFNSIADNKRFIDVYGKNNHEENYVIEVSDDFIKLSEYNGSVYTEKRIIAWVDWSKIDTGTHNGTITVYNADDEGNKKDEVNEFKVAAVKSDVELLENSYMEANGFVAIEAEHFTENLPGKDDSYWAVVENLGQSGDSVKGYPDLAEKVESYKADDAAKLIYRVYFETTGTFNGKIYRLPTLNEGSENNVARSCNIGIGLLGENVTVLSGNRDTEGTWGSNVMRGYEPLTFSLEIPEKGYYDIVIYKLDASVAFDRIVIETTETDSSLVGPPESPNNIALMQEPVIGKVPEAVINTMPEAYVQGLGNFTVGKGTVSEKNIEILSGATINFASDKPNVAQAECADGKLIVYGLDEGTAIITAEIKAEGYTDGEVQFAVIVTDEVKVEGYKEINGELIINAADALKQTDYAKTTASADNVHTWIRANNGSSIQVTPNTGKNWLNSSAIASAPKLSFKATFTTPGTYYVAGNFSNPDDGSDSFHFGLNGSVVFSSNTRNNRVVTKNQEWLSHSSWTVNIPSAGEYELNVWSREDGLVMNQLYLSKTQITDGSLGVKVTQEETDEIIERELTDKERVSLDTRFVKIAEDLNAVSTDLNLPKVGFYGSRIKWTSSNESVVSVDGKVTRPKLGEGEITVSLTGEFEGEEEIETVIYTLRIKEKEEVIKSEAGFGYIDFNSATGHKYISFELTVDEISDGFIGITSDKKVPTAYSDYAICFRICPDGFFDAHNGTTYTATNKISYEEGKEYYIVIDADVEKQLYSAYVICDGQMSVVAEDFGFRTQADELSRMTVCPGSGVAEDLFEIKNLAISDEGYYISALSLTDKEVSADVFFYGAEPKEGVLYIAYYTADNELETVYSSLLNVSFGESVPIKVALPEGTKNMQIMILDHNLKSLARHRGVNLNVW